jgi:hypothetical protein
MRKPVLLSKKVFANARLIKITIKDRYLGIEIGKQNKLIVGFDRGKLTGLTPLFAFVDRVSVQGACMMATWNALPSDS